MLREGGVKIAQASLLLSLCVYNYATIFKKMWGGEEHVTTYLDASTGKKEVFWVKLNCGFFWVPNFPISFLLKCYCIFLKTFGFFCELGTWGYISASYTVAAHPLSAAWSRLCAASAPFSYLFSLENTSLSCQHAIGWTVCTWTLPLVPLLQCSSRTIILLWWWQSLSLWSVPGIQSKQAMPTLKGGGAAAAKSECRGDSEESKLPGIQNLQLKWGFVCWLLWYNPSAISGLRQWPCC